MKKAGPRGYPEAACGHSDAYMTTSTDCSSSVLTAASEQRSGPADASAPFAPASIAPKALTNCRYLYCLAPKGGSASPPPWRRNPHLLGWTCPQE